MLRVATFFSGYDSQCMALRDLGVDFDLVAWSEVDKYAIAAHNAVFPQYAGRNVGDITTVDAAALPDFDLMTYSSPCQDFSTAGRRQGGQRGSGTKSSLLWYCEDIIRVKRPRFLLMENVKALVSRKFLQTFKAWEATLRRYGYTNYTAVLNAKNYGVPQNRERVFCVSIHDGGWYEFPHPEPLRKRLRDILEPDVAEKYNLSPVMIEGLLRHNDKHNKRGSGFIFRPKTPDDIANTLRANAAFAATDTAVILQRGRGFNAGGIHEIAPTVSAHSYERNNFIMQVVPSQQEPYRVYSPQGVSPTLKTCGGGGLQPKILTDEHCIRRLTPREFFRLMGVSDADFDKIKAAGISDTQLYKLAGNSIVVPVLIEIFKQLFRFNTED